MSRNSKYSTYSTRIWSPYHWFLSLILVFLFKTESSVFSSKKNVWRRALFSRVHWWSGLHEFSKTHFIDWRMESSITRKKYPKSHHITRSQLSCSYCRALSFFLVIGSVAIPLWSFSRHECCARHTGLCFCEIFLLLILFWEWEHVRSLVKYSISYSCVLWICRVHEGRRVWTM